MGNGGRPRALDKVKQREVCALVAAGFSLAGAGRYVDCSARTIRREAGRDAAFGEHLRKSQLTAQLEPLRALRGKACTHWRAAAWLLERVDPKQFARYDSKLLTPEEVGDLLDNIKRTLKVSLRDNYDQFMAGGVVDAARNQANLPHGRRNVYAKLNDVPPADLPNRLDDLRSIYGHVPAKPSGDEECGERG